MVDRKRLIRLAQKLIRIDSQNPPGDEYRIGLFVENYLKALGLKTKIYAFKKKRNNVIATLKARHPKGSLLITPHLDTVPAGKSWRRDPFSGKIEESKLFGLGATDCKGNLACALEAIQGLVENRTVLDYNLVFAATADEEAGSELGLIPLLEKGILSPDAAVVLDSDDFNIIITQKGLIHLKIKIEGKRAHGAYPWRGINAIDMAADVIRDLKRHNFRYPRDGYLRPPTMNTGTIRGGDKVNIVADWCEFELDIRFLPGMSPNNIIKEIKNITARHTRKFKIEVQAIQKPYQISRRHSLVSQLAKAMRRLNIKPAIKGSEGATVITFFQNKSIPAVATGFGSGGCAHSADEHVKIDNLYKGAQVLGEFLKNYRFN